MRDITEYSYVVGREYVMRAIACHCSDVEAEEYIFAPFILITLSDAIILPATPLTFH